MGRLPLIIIGQFFLLAGVGFGQAIFNPAGVSTVPPSSLRSGLVDSPNPIDTSGNLIITGNVAGGKHFLGVVPYQSPSQFWGTAGSSSLDSFLRYSAGSENFGRYISKLRPFYPTSTTVTTTRSGHGVVFRPFDQQSRARQVGQQAGSVVSTGQGSSLENLRYKPDAATPERFELTPVTPPGSIKQTTPGTFDFVGTGRVSGSQSEKGMQEILRGATSVQRDIQGRTGFGLDGKGALSIKQYGPGQEYRNEFLGREGQRALDIARPWVEEVAPLSQEKAGREEEVSGAGAPDKLEAERDIFGELLTQPQAEGKGSEMLEQVRAVEKVKVGQLFGRPGQAKGTVSEKPDVEEQGSSAIEKPAYTYPDVLGETGLMGGLGGALKGESGVAYKVDSVGQLKTAGYEERARTRIELAGGFESYKERRVKEYLRAAERHLKEGQYYLAADAYTLASVYRTSPEIWFGKSHSLLAAGDYMSSALFLSRALETFARYNEKAKEGGKEQVDTAALKLFSDSFSLIDRDTLEKRISDIKRWQEQSGAAELEFLLAYIYYKSGRLELAREAVEQACRKMADVPTVAVLKKVIELTGDKEGSGR